VLEQHLVRRELPGLAEGIEALGAAHHEPTARDLDELVDERIGIAGLRRGLGLGLGARARARVGLAARRHEAGSAADRARQQCDQPWTLTHHPVSSTPSSVAIAVAISI